MDSLHSEFKEEEIDGYACESCKQRTLTKKQASIWRLPKVLILSLKRFTPMGTRDNTPLVYNGEPLSFESVFAPESTEKSRATKFKLFATVDHHGSHMGGHYTSQCFSPVWKRWHRYDDETVSEIDAARFGAQTYILMLR
jgi:ubiquitin C-terminal hydrolase